MCGRRLSLCSARLCRSRRPPQESPHLMRVVCLRCTLQIRGRSPHACCTPVRLHNPHVALRAFPPRDRFAKRNQHRSPVRGDEMSHFLYLLGSPLMHLGHSSSVGHLYRISFAISRRGGGGRARRRCRLATSVVPVLPYSTLVVLSSRYTVFWVREMMSRLSRGVRVAEAHLSHLSLTGQYPGDT